MKFPIYPRLLCKQWLQLPYAVFQWKSNLNASKDHSFDAFTFCDQHSTYNCISQLLITVCLQNNWFPCSCILLLLYFYWFLCLPVNSVNYNFLLTVFLAITLVYVCVLAIQEHIHWNCATLRCTILLILFLRCFGWKKLNIFRPTYVGMYVYLLAALCGIDHTDCVIAANSMRQQKRNQQQQEWWQKSCARACPAGQLMNHEADVPPWRMSDAHATPAEHRN